MDVTVGRELELPLVVKEKGSSPEIVTLHLVLLDKKLIGQKNRDMGQGAEVSILPQAGCAMKMFDFTQQVETMFS